VPINTTDGPVERLAHPDSAQRHINTSRVVEEGLIYEDSEAEVESITLRLRVLERRVERQSERLRREIRTLEARVWDH
jgi:hypothetical protein